MSCKRIQLSMSLRARNDYFVLILQRRLGRSLWESIYLKWLFSVLDVLHAEGALDQKHWATVYPSCAGKRQSPIDIQRHNVKYNPSMLQLELTGYDAQKGNFLMSNNGHTGELRNVKGPCHSNPRSNFVSADSFPLHALFKMFVVPRFNISHQFKLTCLPL